MSTFTRQKPSQARGQRAIRSLDPRDGATRIAIRGVGWQVYDVLSDAVREGAPVHVNYDGRDLEIMATSDFHEQFKHMLGRFVHEVTTALAVPVSSSGQTTWKRPELARGLEADQCYHFHPEKIAVVAAARKRRSMDIADYPNPDMAIEIDISPPQVDREGIYKSLQVTEIWRFDGEDVTIERLGEDGTYVGADISRFLPVKAVEIRRWIVEEDWSEQTAWCLRLRAWLRRLSRERKPQPKRPRRRKNGA
jgi:hypothetical protein